MTRTVRTFTAAAIVFLLSASLCAQTVHVPHLVFDKPAATGTIRAIFLLNNTAWGEADELARRSDLTPLVVPVKGDAYGNRFDGAALDGFLRGPWDCVVIAASEGWEAVPAESQTLILAGLKQGRGIVFVDRDPGQAFLAGVLADARPDEATVASIRRAVPAPLVGAKTRVRCYGSAGTPRVAVVSGMGIHWVRQNAFVPAKAQAPFTHFYWEHYYALFARVVRWSAGRAPATAWTKLTSDRSAIHVAWTEGKDGAVPAKLGVRFLDDYGRLAAVLVIDDVRAGARDIPLPDGLYGHCVAELRLVDAQGRVLDWGSVPLALPCPAQIEKVDLSASFVRPGEAFTGRVGLTADRGGAFEGSLAALLIDPDGAVVGRETQPLALAAGGRRDLAVSLAAPSATVAVGHRLITTVRDKAGRPVLERRLTVAVLPDRSRNPARYHVIVWPFRNDYYRSIYGLQAMRTLGVDAVCTVGKNAGFEAQVLAAGLRAVPTNICVPPNRFSKDAEFDWEANRARLTEWMRDYRGYGVLGYSLADEPNTTDPAAFLEKPAALIRSMDPGARVGYCGVWINGRKFSPRSFFQAADFAEVYSPLRLSDPDLWAGCERDLHRSFLRRGESIYTAWAGYIGGAEHEAMIRTRPWLMLFEGGNGISYFAPSDHTCVRPDLTPSPELLWGMEEVGRIETGVDLALLAATRDDGNVRIYCPPPGKVEGAGLKAVYDGSTRAAREWCRLLNRERIPFRFVSDVEIQAGALGQEKVAILLAPAALFCPPATQNEITRFVERGGRLVTDSLLGLMDSAALSGLKVNEKGFYASNFIPVTARAGATVLRGVSFGSFEHVPASKARREVRFATVGTAEAKDEKAPDSVRRVLGSPAQTEESRGTGRALRLGLIPDAADDATAAFYAGLLKQWGASGTGVTLRAADGRPAHWVYVYPYVAGGVRYYGLIRDYVRGGEGGEVAFELERPAHVFDARDGKYLGKVKRGTIRVDAGRPRLLAVYPYRPSAPALAAPRSVQPGQTMTVTVRIGSEGGEAVGDHAVQVTASGPDGEARSLRRRFLCRAGRGSVSLFVPFSARAGAWRLIARDAITGLKTECALRVEGTTVAWSPGLAGEGVRLNVEEAARTAAIAAPLKPERTREGDSVHGAVQEWSSRPIWHMKGHEAHRFLRTGFTLRNRLINYHFRYWACNDWQKHGWKEKNRIWTPYPCGLGMDRPCVGNWYYNGYFDAYYGHSNIGGYRPEAIELVEGARPGGRGAADATRAWVVVRWKTPVADATLDFVLLPDSRFIYQRLRITPPRIPGLAPTLRVVFRSYTAGFGPFRETVGRGAPGIVPENRSRSIKSDWLFLCDRIMDRAFSRGEGPCGIVVGPHDADTLKWGSCAIELDKKVASQEAAAGGPMLEDDLLGEADETRRKPAKPSPRTTVRWAIWAGGDLSNEEALRVFTKELPLARRHLEEVFVEKRK